LNIVHTIVGTKVSRFMCFETSIYLNVQDWQNRRQLEWWVYADGWEL